MGIFDWFCCASSESSFDSASCTDYGVNPSTGLSMMNGAVDVGGNMFGCSNSASSFDRFDSSSAFDDD